VSAKNAQSSDTAKRFSLGTKYSDIGKCSGLVPFSEENYEYQDLNKSAVVLPPTYNQGYGGTIKSSGANGMNLNHFSIGLTTLPF
jgi:hypothetical protein